MSKPRRQPRRSRYANNAVTMTHNIATNLGIGLPSGRMRLFFMKDPQAIVCVHCIMQM